MLQLANLYHTCQPLFMLLCVAKAGEKRNKLELCTTRNLILEIMMIADACAGTHYPKSSMPFAAATGQLFNPLNIEAEVVNQKKKK